MKKVLTLLAALFVSAFFLLPATANAATAAASLSGPGTVRAGDTITLTFRLSGTSLSGAMGTLSYNDSQLTLVGTKQVIAAPWVVEFSGASMVAYDNNLSNPISGTKDLFQVTFKVKNVAPGTVVSVAYTEVVASKGKVDENIGTVRYSVATAAPLSGNVDLSALTVGNASLSPAFSPNVTSYAAEVPFHVSKLDIQAAAADAKAKVSIQNPALAPGGATNVVVTVTAESGAKKSYTIKVQRAPDPNYVPSGNNQLANITVEGFLLSPVFSAEISRYVVWLPYETESVKAGASPADGKASVQVAGGEALAAGQDNLITIICTAENGEKREYTVIAKRAPAHDQSIESLPPASAAPEPPESVFSSGVSQAVASQEPPQRNSGGVPIWVPFATGLVCLGLGIGAGILLVKQKERR